MLVKDIVEVGKTYLFKDEGSTTYVKAKVQQFPFTDCTGAFISINDYSPIGDTYDKAFVYLEADGHCTFSSIGDNEELGGFYKDIVPC